MKYDRLLIIRRLNIVIVIFLLLQFIPKVTADHPKSLSKFSQTSSQSDRDIFTLTLDKIIERDFIGEQNHIYQVTLESGQFIRITLEKRNIHLIMSLLDKEDNLLADVGHSTGAQGEEFITIITKQSGIYRLIINSPAHIKGGHYKLKLTELRAAIPSDNKLISAQQLFTTAEKLQSGKTAALLSQAIEKYLLVLPEWQVLKEQLRELQTLGNIAQTYADLHDNEKASDYYKQALKLSIALKDHYEELAALVGLGTIYDDLGDKQQAMEYYRTALPISKIVGDQEGEVALRNNIGKIYNDIGEYRTAINYYNQAVEILQAIGDIKTSSIILNNIGSAYDTLGEKQRAIDYFSKSLKIKQILKESTGEATTLNNIGLLYSSLGQKKRALDYYNQALVIRKNFGDKALIANSLSNIGSIYQALGESDKAIDYFLEALPLCRGAADPRKEASILSNLGASYCKVEKTAKALDAFNQALELRRKVKDRQGEGATLSNFGVVYLSRKETQKARDYFNQALSLFVDVADRRREAATLYQLARIDLIENRLSDAQEKVYTAIERAEYIRNNVLNEDLRLTYSATIYEYYELAIEILMRLHKAQPAAGYDGKAMEMAESARARSLLDLLNESQINFSQDIDITLKDREVLLQQKLLAKEQERSKLLNGSYTKAQKETLDETIDLLLTDYHQVQSEIKFQSPRYAELFQPQKTSIKQIQELLDQDTLLLEYKLGNEQSYLWAITTDSINSFELPGRVQIETAAQTFYKLLTAREITKSEKEQWQQGGKEHYQNRVKDADEQFPQANMTISNMLVAPIRAMVGTKRLLIITEGALQYIPFAALTTTNSKQESVPLILDHEIVNLPSASIVVALRARVKEKSATTKLAAVFADPIFHKDDERINPAGVRRHNYNKQTGKLRKRANVSVTSSEAQRLDLGDEIELSELDRLYNSATEANAIIRMTTRVRAHAWLGGDANRKNVLAPSLKDYKIIHFATHGLYNSTHPGLSALLLSFYNEGGVPQNGFLYLNDIYNLKWPRTELVVLSACKTALGKDIQGEGLLGLTRGFIYAGTPRVVASLWTVQDIATMLLMSRFYQGMLKEKHLTPSAALRAAQLYIRNQPRLAAPYYWANFSLQGDWR